MVIIGGSQTWRWGKFVEGNCFFNGHGRWRTLGKRFRPTLKSIWSWITWCRTVQKWSLNSESFSWFSWSEGTMQPVAYYLQRAVDGRGKKLKNQLWGPRTLRDKYMLLAGQDLQQHPLRGERECAGAALGTNTSLHPWHLVSPGACRAPQQGLNFAACCVQLWEGCCSPDL